MNPWMRMLWKPLTTLTLTGVLFLWQPVASLAQGEPASHEGMMMTQPLTTPAAAPSDGSVHKKEMEAAPPPAAVMEQSVIGISGFVDTYYAYNFNKPSDKLNRFTNFDFSDNAFSINLAEVVVQRSAEPVGFRIDVDYGQAANAVNEAPLVNLQQAYVSYVPTPRLTLDAGKYVTHLGAEVIETKDNWNYSRGLLFSWAIPYYHAGLRLTYSLTDNITIMGTVNNGWNNVGETNRAKTAGASLTIKPTAASTLVLNYIGPAREASYAQRHVVDFVAMLNATDNLALMLNADYGTQKLLPGNVKSQYVGAAAYARYAASGWAGSIRYEYTKDSDDFLYGTGLGPNVQEITLTGERAIADHMLLRLEFRRDFADKKIFDRRGSAVEDQNRVTLGSIVYF